MNSMDAITSRHSVRQYTERIIDENTLVALKETIAQCNSAGDLNIQLCVNEPTAFTSMMARYGKFTNVKNYIALVGKPSKTFDEKCGYYGEKIVLKAQQLGLNTCWVALTFNKRKSKHAISINPGEKLLLVISVGYGATEGVPHKGKSIEELAQTTGIVPPWFQKGMEAVQLAPTAMNQQKFLFALHKDEVTATAGRGFYTKVDLGIAKYHFEVGAGDNGWKWKD